MQQATISKLALKRTDWAAYSAAIWAFVFAAMSFYWAAGGRVGANTIDSAITAPVLAHDPRFIALLWGTGAFKVGGGVVALALVQPWGRIIPLWLLLTVTWTAGIGMVVYGGIPLIVNGFMVAGLLHITGNVDWTAIRWHFFLWDPWWLIGGICFVIAARTFSKISSR